MKPHASGRPVRFDLGSADDLHLALAPLSEVTQAIIEDLISRGEGNRCGECDRPFTSARKRRGVARILTSSDAGIGAVFYILCGACRSAAERRKREGGSVVTEFWRDEARAIHDAGRLMNRSAEGHA